jgi:hypothetical protein
MRDIAALTMFLRDYIDLPDGLTIGTKEFREGWNLVCSGDVQWLDKKIRARGWHFIWIAESLRRGGVGKTSQEAIASALKSTLRHVGARFNAAKIEHIGLKKYPWFFLATVTVYPYRIQQSAALSMPDTTLKLSMPFTADTAMAVETPVTQTI